VFRAVVLADAPMLTPEEFPHIAAHVVPAEPAAVPRTAERVVPEPAAIEIAEPAGVSEPGEALTVFNDDGDVRPLAEIEAAMIRLALERYQGRMTLVARKL